MVLVSAAFEVAPCVMSDAVSLTSELADAQPMISTMEKPVMLISPALALSIVYSSVTALPAPIIDHPSAVVSGRSFTCGACPEPYPEPPEPICVVKPLVVPLLNGRFAVTQILPVSVNVLASSM